MLIDIIIILNESRFYHVYPQIIIIVIIAFRYNRIVKRTEDIWTGDFWSTDGLPATCAYMNRNHKKEYDLSISLDFPLVYVMSWTRADAVYKLQAHHAYEVVPTIT